MSVVDFALAAAGCAACSCAKDGTVSARTRASRVRMRRYIRSLRWTSGMTWLADCSIQCREIGKVKMEIGRRPSPPVFHQVLILKGVEGRAGNSICWSRNEKRRQDAGWGYRNWKSEDLRGTGCAELMAERFITARQN